MNTVHTRTVILLALGVLVLVVSVTVGLQKVQAQETLPILVALQPKIAILEQGSASSNKLMHTRQITNHLEISTITPSTIYNTLTNTLRIRGNNLTRPLTVTLNNEVLPLVGTSVTNTLVSAQVARGFVTGTHELEITLADGRVTTARQIVVLGPINPEVTWIEPLYFIRRQDGDVTIRIQGHNLDQMSGGSFRPFYNQCKFGSNSCPQVISATSEQIELRFAVSAEFNTNVPSSNIWTFSFPDGSFIQATSHVVDNVLPWNIASWIGLVLYVIAGVIVCLAIVLGFEIGVNQTTGSRTQIGHSRSRSGLVSSSLPRYWSIHLLFVVVVVGLGSLSTLWLLISSFFGGRDSISGTFFLSSALLVFCLVMPWVASAYSKTFYPIIPPVARIVLASAAFLAGVALPSLLIYSPWTVIALQIAVALAVWISAILALSAGKRAIVSSQRQEHYQRRQAINDDELLLEIEQVLFQNGVVTIADIPDLSKERVEQALRLFHTQRPEAGGRTLERDSGQLRLNRAPAVDALSKAFRNARRPFTTPVIATRLLSDLAGVVQQQLGLTTEPETSGTIQGRFFIINASAPELESILPTAFPLVILAPPGTITSEEVRELLTILAPINRKPRFALLIPLVDEQVVAEQIRKELKLRPSRENIAVLGEQGLKVVLSSAQATHASLMKEFSSLVDLNVFSPYKSQAGTKLDMFYGRQAEVGTIKEKIASSSIAVIGARRIGKTSVLQTVTRELRNDGRHVYYLDCQSVLNYASFFRTVARRCEINRARLIAEMGTDIDVTLFADLVDELSHRRPGEPVIFILDEVDRILAYDLHLGDTIPSGESIRTAAQAERNEQLFRSFRALAQEDSGKCQFIFSGERLILDRRHNPQSSLFNFVEPIELGLLNRTAVYDLVVRPMSLISITLQQPEEIVDRIFASTAGHPFLVQFICERLVRQLGYNRGGSTQARVITTNMVDAIVHAEGEIDVGEGQTYRDRFLETFWSQASGRERAISLYVAEQETVKADAISAWLQQVGFPMVPREIDSALRYLTLNQLLKINSGGYSIQPARFREYLAYYGTSYWLKQFAEPQIVMPESEEKGNE